MNSQFTIEILDGKMEWKEIFNIFNEINFVKNYLNMEQQPPVKIICIKRIITENSKWNGQSATKDVKKIREKNNLKKKDFRPLQFHIDNLNEYFYMVRHKQDPTFSLN